MIVNSLIAIVIVVSTLLLAYLISIINPVYFEKWISIFTKFLLNIFYNFPKCIKSFFDRRSVAADIQYAVNSVCDKIDDNCPGIFPHAIKIEWVKEDNRDSFIKKNTVVVQLRNYANQDRNIVESTLLYLNTGLLPRFRSYLDDMLIKSIEFFIAAKIFHKDGSSGAYDYFYEHIYKPAKEQNNDIERDVTTLYGIDQKNYFSCVFMQEIIRSANSMLGTIGNQNIQNEHRDFLNFLFIIATKAESEDVPLTFIRSMIKTSIILVAKRKKIATEGIEPYIRAISFKVKQGLDSLFISGWGEQNSRYVLDISKKTDRKDILVKRKYITNLTGGKKAVLLYCLPNLALYAERERSKCEVVSALEEILPEINDGKIEIVSVVRELNSYCKTLLSG